ncbi:putative transmembrane glycoprotein [Talaromyces proteolyticus]|uniref:Transmembrane glycoprotein n=1 Tax=Talaromyces proteolyticus TaxID=1131652 RepID=A0AAD4KVG4_9EURO|nr:putative transmembrane glycoprotein [Talaromyces proteolyticus]KAH8697029.1 putative transmembrane glycoprotein [Talaromyces proteolyticus]
MGLEKMAKILYLALLVVLMSIADAIPTANYPVNAQLPPVARVNRPFSFTFSSSTFVGGGAGLTYSLLNAPGWLHVDTGNLTLYGTPGPGDAEAAQFLLVATDQSGPGSMSVTLVVSSEPGPRPEQPLLAQLQKIGPTSSPATIFMYPGRPFTIAFDPETTFANTQLNTVYYATSSPYNSPLPSWMTFDSSRLQFSGNSPSNPSSIPQSFNFNMIASDAPGFSAATVSFQIVVSQHILSFNSTTRTLNFTRGQPFSTPHFIDDLSLDGHGVVNQNISHIEIEGASWLTLDNETISLSGTAPGNAGNETIVVTVTDSYQDKARLDVQLMVSQLFAKGVESCNATIGEKFSYTFDKSLLSDDTVHLQVDLAEVSSWANYDAASMSLSGHVPDDMKPQTFSIKLTATQGSTVETRNLNLTIFKPGKAGVVNDQSSSGGNQDANKRKVKIIAIAVAIPVGVILIVAILLVLFCRHRRSKAKGKNQNDENLRAADAIIDSSKSEKNYHQTSTSELPRSSSDSSNHSAPMQLELDLHLSNASFREEEDESYRSPTRAIQPQKTGLEWNLADEAVASASQQPNISPKRNASVSQSSPLSHRSTKRYSKREPLKPIQNRSFKRDSAMSTKSKRYSRRSSGLTTVASGLPVRLSGAGHGAGGFGLSRPEMVRASWQTTQMSLQSDDTSIENLSTMFPRPPLVRKRNSSNLSRSYDYTKRASFKGSGTTPPTPPEPDSIEAFIQSRARSRNSGNPLFSSRMDSRASSGYRALEKSRRSSSIAGTSISTSSYIDDRRQSQIRPVSTAMSASIYGDDYRNSIARPMSQISEGDAWNSFGVARTRTNPGSVQRYTDAIAHLPRCFSQASMGSTRKFESGDSMTGSDDYYDLIDERDGPEGRRQWYRVNSHAQSLSNVEEAIPEPVTDSEDLAPVPETNASRVRRMSLLRTGGQDSSPIGNRHWRLMDTQQRRPSIEASDGLDPTTNSSFRGDLAFV